MKVLVSIKRVVDHTIRVRPRADGLDVETTGVKMSVNPFDEHALEEAIRLKEAGVATEVVAVAIGPSSHQDVLRHALAMGADRVVLVDTELALASRTQAVILQAVVEREAPQLVLLGKQAIDDDAAEVGPMLAARLGWAQGSAVSALQVQAEQVTVTREIDGGQEQVRLRLPAVLSADLRLNAPRFVKLPNLMMAKKKPITHLPLAELTLQGQPVTALLGAARVQVLKVEEAPARKPGVRVQSVQELVQKLRDEAGVL